MQAYNKKKKEQEDKKDQTKETRPKTYKLIQSQSIFYSVSGGFLRQCMLMANDNDDDVNDNEDDCDDDDDNDDDN